MRKMGDKLELAFSVEGHEPNADDVSPGDNEYSQSSQGSRAAPLSEKEFLACIADALDDLQRAAAVKGYTRLTELLRAAHVQALMDGYQHHRT